MPRAYGLIFVIFTGLASTALPLAKRVLTPFPFKGSPHMAPKLLLGYFSEHYFFSLLNCSGGCRLVPHFPFFVVSMPRLLGCTLHLPREER